MSNVTDIEEIVRAWAWNTFLKTRSRDHSKLKLDEVHLDINWQRVRFTPTMPDYSDREMVETPKSQIVFKSTFDNRTDHDQEHSFQTERTTTCSSTTTVMKGYTKGFNVELSLALPEEVASLTAGFGREVTMEAAEEDTHEQTLTWAVDSTIKVAAHHRTTAEMVVREQQFNANFKMEVKIRGTVIVCLTNLKDNNSFVQSIEGDIAQILEDEARRGRQGYAVQGRSVVYMVEGKCEFRFGIEQKVKLHEEALSGDEDPIH